MNAYERVHNNEHAHDSRSKRFAKAAAPVVADVAMAAVMQVAVEGAVRRLRLKWRKPVSS